MGQGGAANQFTYSYLCHTGSSLLLLTMAEKTSLIRVSTWAGHLRADGSYRSAVDAARQLSVSLLTVSHVSHSISRSGVHKACSQLVNQFVTRLWFVAQIFALPCYSTKQVSWATCTLYVVAYFNKQLQFSAIKFL